MRARNSGVAQPHRANKRSECLTQSVLSQSVSQGLLARAFITRGTRPTSWSVGLPRARRGARRARPRRGRGGRADTAR